MSLDVFYQMEQLHFYKLTNQHSGLPVLEFHDFYYN